MTGNTRQACWCCSAERDQGCHCSERMCFECSRCYACCKCGGGPKDITWAKTKILQDRKAERIRAMREFWQSPEAKTLSEEAAAHE